MQTEKLGASGSSDFFLSSETLMDKITKMTMQKVMEPPKFHAKPGEAKTKTTPSHHDLFEIKKSYCQLHEEEEIVFACYQCQMMCC